MIKNYMIPVYALLVKSGKMVLEATGVENEKIVPEEYQVAVAEFLAS